MKKFIIYTLASFLTLTFIPNESKASTGITPSAVTIDSAMLKTNLLNRLEEIKKMDKSDLSFSEKKALHKEVRSIDKTLHDGYGGVYISVGGLLLIILILILIF